MMPVERVIGNARALHGDMRDVLPLLPADSFDACVTDPPYHLTSGNAVYDYAQHGGKRKSSGGGFMGQRWDGGDIAFRPETWGHVLRVMKPGGHLLAFGGTRTQHRMICAIEDAGFEVRDCILWIYGSGFPKSLDVSKAIDRAAGVEREVVGKGCAGLSAGNFHQRDIGSGAYGYAADYVVTAPATPEAQAWQGWGTALKPACEIVVLARKPLSERTVAANVLRHGTGAGEIYARAGRKDVGKTVGFGDAGSASRFFMQCPPGAADRLFYSSKADAQDRCGSRHPTIKPIALMRWLLRLVTPPNGAILDPFAGSGATGMAALAEGMRPTLIEREANHFADIIHRLQHVGGADTPLFSSRSDDAYDAPMRDLFADVCAA